MIFRRNKPTATPDDGQPVMRGRESAEDKSNPLARRFHPDDEPDTIDLQQPAGFNDEPGTAGLAMKAESSDHLGVVTHAPDTGKYYVQPGHGDEVTYLGDEPVRAPTELRPGDRIRIGDIELQLIRKGQE